MEVKILDYPVLTEEEIEAAKKKLGEVIVDAMLAAELKRGIWTGAFIEKGEFKNPLVHEPVYKEFETRSSMTITVGQVTPHGKIMIVRWK